MSKLKEFVFFFTILSAVNHSATGKSFLECELLQELLNVHKLTIDESRHLVCIAQQLSGLNTNLIVGSKYGIFQINKKWCNSKQTDKLCNVKCSSFLDDDISDDVSCARQIFMLNGINAWRLNKTVGCQKEFQNIEENCLISQVRNCKFVKKLVDTYDISKLDAFTWACIAEHHDNNNTFKETGNQELNDDLTCIKNNDIECAVKIQKQSGRRSFSSWPSFERFCLNILPIHAEKCFLKEILKSTIEILKPLKKTDENIKTMQRIFTTSTEVSIIINDDRESMKEESTTEFLSKTIDIPNINNANDIKLDGFSKVRIENAITVESTTENFQMSAKAFNEEHMHVQQEAIDEEPEIKAFDLCNLANQLVLNESIHIDDIADYLCIADKSSKLRIKKRNINFEPMGIFGLKESTCGEDEIGGSCSMKCSDFLNYDISDDVQCVTKVLNEFGLVEWDLDSEVCNNYKKKFLQCINDDKINVEVKNNTYIDFDLNPFGILLARNLEIISKTTVKSEHDILTTDSPYYSSVEEIINDFPANYYSSTGSLVKVTKRNDDFATQDDESIETTTISEQDMYIPFEIETKNTTFEQDTLDNREVENINQTENLLEASQGARKSSTLFNLEYLDKCSLVKNLNDSGRLPNSLVSTFICIAEHESRFNVSLVKKYHNQTKFGLFQIDDLKYCSTNEKINYCDVLCAHLNDDQLDNDFECAKHIYEKEGFDYWPSYSKFCLNIKEGALTNCYTTFTTTHRPFTILNVEAAKYKLQASTTAMAIPEATTPPIFVPKLNYTDDESRFVYRAFSLCELTEVLYLNDVALDDIPYYVCIGQEKGKLRIRDPLNFEENLGIFFINREFCGFNETGGKCSMQCSELLNYDIVDDISCAKTIYNYYNLQAWNLSEEACKSYVTTFLQCYESNSFQTTKVIKSTTVRNDIINTPILTTSYNIDSTDIVTESSRELSSKSFDIILTEFEENTQHPLSDSITELTSEDFNLENSGVTEIEDYNLPTESVTSPATDTDAHNVLQGSKKKENVRFHLVKYENAKQHVKSIVKQTDSNSTLIFNFYIFNINV